MRSAFLLPLAMLAVPARAQETQPPAEDAASRVGSVVRGNEIVVTAERIRGQVQAPEPPVVVLDEAAIASYGAASLADLLDELGPETGSGRGRGDGHPVVLLNGQRISSFRELRDIPPEAIRRVEVLPEEVALRYGYPPDQRVVNFVLKDHFASKTVAGEYHLPTLGGFDRYELQGGSLRIDGPRRLNVTGKLDDTSMLTEAERHLRQTDSNTPTVASDPDPARYRSLIDADREATLNATWSTGLGEGGAQGSLSLNGTVTQSDTRSLFGLDTVTLTAPDGSTARRALPGPLTRISHATTVQAGATLNKPLWGWQLTATLDASHGDTRTSTDQKRGDAALSTLVEAAQAGTLPIDGTLPVIAAPGADHARTRDDALTSLVTLVGKPFRMPAGEASLTVKGGFAYTASDNSDTQTGAPAKLKRGDASAGLNLALPLTSAHNHVLGAIGDVSFNASAGIDHLSDFGTLTDWSAGLTWSPTQTLSFQASYIVNEAPPSLAQLGNPQQLAYNVSVYDFTRSEVALVTVINGGNPALTSETQRDLKLSANWRLPFLRRSNLIVEYFRNRSSDVTESFPLLTPAIEAAFPGRVVRDPATGALLSIDRRPVTFSEIRSSRLRWGFNLSGSLGSAEGGRGGHGGGGRGPMGRGGGGGRWNLAVYHTFRFTDRATIMPSGPVLDLLGGDALTSGGEPRHEVELEGGLFRKGVGLRLNGTWTAPVHIAASQAPNSSDLRFGSTFVLKARLFVNLGEQQSLVEAAPFVKGMRLSFKVDNILDSRQKVTDASGQVPISYQADYRDPQGRIVSLELRKMF